MFVTKMINVELKTSNTIRNTKRKTFYYVVNKMFFSFVFPGTTYIIKCFSLCISRHDLHNKMFFSFVFPGTTYIIKCFSLLCFPARLT